MAVRRNRRRTRNRNQQRTVPKPADVLPSSIQSKPDPASISGPGGAPSGPARIDRRVSLRTGAAVGTGLGLAGGLTFGLPKLFDGGLGGDGGFFDGFTNDPDKPGGGNENPPGQDETVLGGLADTIGVNKGLLALLLGAGGLIYLARRKP